MRNPLFSLDIYFLVKEINKIEGGYITKIWSISKNYYVFGIRKEGNEFFLHYKLPGLIWVSKIKPSAEKPTKFAQLLRARIERKKVRKIEQINSERILRLELEDQYLFVIECIPPGNMVLCRRSDGKWFIEDALIKREWKDRSIKPGEVYKPTQGFDYLHCNRKELEEVVRIKSEEKENIAKALANMGLGGRYAEELVARAKIDKEEINESNIKKVVEALIEVKNVDEVKGYMYEEEAYPIKMISFGDPNKIFNSFSEAIEEATMLHVPEPEEIRKIKEEIEAIKKSIKLQKEAVNKNKELVEKYRNIGEMIYQYYNKITTLIEDYNKGIGIEELKKNHPYVIKVKDGKLVLDGEKLREN